MAAIGEKKRRPPICLVCGHLSHEGKKSGLLCSAFPNGVPMAIAHNEVDHRQAFEGDNGVRYDPVGNSNLSPQEAADYASRLFDHKKL